MKNILAIMSAFLVILMTSGLVNAALTTIGTATYQGSDYNLIWDDNNNGNSLVWLDYLGTRTSWDNQVAWASSLNEEGTLAIDLYDGYAVNWGGSSWRLPATFGSYGYNQTASEMGHLFYEELDINYGYATNAELNATNFDNLSATWLWSGTEYSDSTISAWYFYVFSGFQGTNAKVHPNYALVVRNGQVMVSSVPIPGTVLLLGAGIASLAVAGRRKKKDV